MPFSIDPKRLIPPRRRLPIAALMSGALMAGCGGSSHSPTPATAGDATSSASTVAATATTSARSTTSKAATSSGSTARATYESGPLGFARCMRANGVPNFPDPEAGGGTLFAIPAGTSPTSPAFEGAQAKCHKLLPGGGLLNSGPPPSTQTLTKLLRIAVCMRQHGVPQFPDPRTSAPASFPPGIAEISNFDGAVLLFPQTLNLQAPAYRQALAACGAPPFGLSH